MRGRLLLLVALGAAGCTNFADPTTVVDLRILAVKVEPSEIILDAQLDNGIPVVDPTNNPGVKVTPLIVDPAGGGRPVTYTISACPNDPFAPAPPGGGQGGGAFPSGGARTTVGSALCDPASPKTWLLTPAPVDVGAPFVVTPTVDQLAVAFMTDVFPDQYGNLHGGFDLGMPLTLDIKVDAGGEEIRGIKRVLYWLQRIDDAQTANQNPVVEALRTYPGRDPATLEPAGTVDTIDAAMPFTVPVGSTSIWIEPAAATGEPFETTVIDPDTHQAVPFSVPRETLRYRFFATAGSFSPAATSSEPDPGFVATGPIHIESKYNVPGRNAVATDANGRAIVTIWVVVRDDRGGETWIQRQLEITPP